MYGCETVVVVQVEELERRYDTSHELTEPACAQVTVAVVFPEVEADKFVGTRQEIQPIVSA